VQEHPFFHREGNDLYCEIPLNYPTAALGGEITIPTLEGEEALKVPEGTQGGAIFRLRGRGMVDVVSGRSRGDLLVTVKVVTPKKVTKEQRKLLEQLAAMMPKEKFEPTPREEHDERGIFDRVKDIFG
jgi:molecular chaperone DnaJ